MVFAHSSSYCFYSIPQSIFLSEDIKMVLKCKYFHSICLPNCTWELPLSGKSTDALECHINVQSFINFPVLILTVFCELLLLCTNIQCLSPHSSVSFFTFTIEIVCAILSRNLLSRLYFLLQISLVFKILRVSKPHTVIVILFILPERTWKF